MEMKDQTYLSDKIFLENKFSNRKRISMFRIARDSRRELEKMACGESRLVGNGVISLSLPLLAWPSLSISFLFFYF